MAVIGLVTEIIGVPTQNSRALKQFSRYLFSLFGHKDTVPASFFPKQDSNMSSLKPHKKSSQNTEIYVTSRKCTDKIRMSKN